MDEYFKRTEVSLQVLYVHIFLILTVLCTKTRDNSCLILIQEGFYFSIWDDHLLCLIRSVFSKFQSDEKQRTAT